MAEFDHGVKMITDTTAPELARVARVKCQRLQPIESTLPSTTELLADRAFRASCGRERFVLYYEFYTRWEKSAPWDMLAKSGLLSQRLHLPTVCVMFILLRRGYHSSRGKFRLESGGAPTQQLWFKEVCLWTLKPEAWWETVPGLMALYPLARHGKEPREAVRHAAEVIERVVVNSGERADLLFLLDIFARLVYRRIDVTGIIGREKMKNSGFAQECRKEGEISSHRAILVKLIQRRFGNAPAAELVPAVNAIDDLALLDRLLDQWASGASLEALRAAMHPTKSAV